jgi:hypothetical protein
MGGNEMLSGVGNLVVGVLDLEFESLVMRESRYAKRGYKEEKTVRQAVKKGKQVINYQY